MKITKLITDRDEAIKAVKEDGHNLTFVLNQDEEICLAAVKNDGYALQYVTVQTEEICLEALRQNYTALSHIKISLSKAALVEIDLRVDKQDLEKSITYDIIYQKLLEWSKDK